MRSLTGSFLRWSLSVGFLGCSLSAGGQQAPRPQPPDFLSAHFDPGPVGMQLPPHLVLHAANGEALDLDSLRGQTVLIHVWSSWCGGCQDMTGVHGIPGVTVLAVDFDRQPEAATAYLAKHQLTIRNFHDDRNAFRTQLKLTLGPFAKAVVIDAEGKVVYAEQAMFHEELEQEMAALGVSVQHTVREKEVERTKMTPLELRTLAREAMGRQRDYVDSQTKYVCRYNITTRDRYDAGYSKQQVKQVDEVMTLGGRHVESLLVTPSGTQRDEGKSAPTETYDVWSDPVLAAVMQHSVLSNIVQTPGNASGHSFLRFTVRGDPTYKAETDEERIAQEIEGNVVMVLPEKVFEVIDGWTAYSVVDSGRYLVDPMMPVLSFRAIPYAGAYLPSVWSQTTFRAVSDGPDAHREWLTTLHRTFGERESCREFRVTSTVEAKGSGLE